MPAVGLLNDLPRSAAGFQRFQLLCVVANTYSCNTKHPKAPSQDGTLPLPTRPAVSSWAGVDLEAPVPVACSAVAGALQGGRGGDCSHVCPALVRGSPQVLVGPHQVVNTLAFVDPMVSAITKVRWAGARILTRVYLNLKPLSFFTIILPK